ncbi:MAG: hypothetical protein ABIB46_02545 [bacterium]
MQNILIFIMVFFMFFTNPIFSTEEKQKKYGLKNFNSQFDTTASSWKITTNTNLVLINTPKLKIENGLNYSTKKKNLINTKENYYNLSLNTSYIQSKKTNIIFNLFGNFQETEYGNKTTNISLSNNNLLKLTDQLNLNLIDGFGISEQKYPIQEAVEKTILIFENKNNEEETELVKNDCFRAIKFYIEESGNYNIWIEIQKEKNPENFKIFFAPDKFSSPDLSAKQEFTLESSLISNTFFNYKIIEKKNLEANKYYWLIFNKESDLSNGYFEYKLSKKNCPEKSAYMEGKEENKLFPVEQRYMNIKITKIYAAANPNNKGNNLFFNPCVSYTTEKITTSLNYNVSHNQHYYLINNSPKQDTSHFIKSSFSYKTPIIFWNCNFDTNINQSQYLEYMTREKKDNKGNSANINLGLTNLGIKNILDLPKLDFTYKYTSNKNKYLLTKINSKNTLEHNLSYNLNFIYKKISFNFKENIELKTENYINKLDTLNYFLHNSFSPEINFETKKIFKRKVGEKNSFKISYHFFKRTLCHNLKNFYLTDTNEVFNKNYTLKYTCLINDKSNLEFSFDDTTYITNYITSSYSQNNNDKFTQKYNLTFFKKFNEKLNFNISGISLSDFSEYKYQKYPNIQYTSYNLDSLMNYAFSPNMKNSVSYNFSHNYSNSYENTQKNKTNETYIHKFSSTYKIILNKILKNIDLNYDFFFNQKYSQYNKTTDKWLKKEDDFYHQITLKSILNLQKFSFSIDVNKLLGSKKQTRNFYNYAFSLNYDVFSQTSVQSKKEENPNEKINN